MIYYYLSTSSIVYTLTIKSTYVRLHQPCYTRDFTRWPLVDVVVNLTTYDFICTGAGERERPDRHSARAGAVLRQISRTVDFSHL